jgi:hypothetical protein
LTKGTGYLVQGPLERLEVKVSRPISYEKYEKIYRIFLKNGLLKLMQLKAETENMNTSGFDSKSLQEEMNKIKSDLNSKVENFKDKHMIDKQKYPEDKLLADLLSAIVKDILKSI